LDDKTNTGDLKMPPVFTRLRALRMFEKRHLNFLRTIEDFDLIREIGYHQERGEPLTMKTLHLLGVASVPTIQRRLRQLRQAGAIQQMRSKRDGRALELRITPKVQRVFARYAELLAAAPTAP
jgi:DNA-binding MarR family transcriptional regulator